MEGARYSRLTYFLHKRNIIRGPRGTDVSVDVLGRCSRSPRLHEQGDSLFCQDVASVRFICFPPQMSSAVATLKCIKSLQLVSQHRLLWISCWSSANMQHFDVFLMFYMPLESRLFSKLIARHEYHDCKFKSNYPETQEDALWFMNVNNQKKKNHVLSSVCKQYK